MWLNQSSASIQSRVWCPPCNTFTVKTPTSVGVFFSPKIYRTHQHLFTPDRKTCRGLDASSWSGGESCVAWRCVACSLPYNSASWACGSSPHENKLYGGITHEIFWILQPPWYQFQRAAGCLCSVFVSFDCSNVRLFGVCSVLMLSCKHVFSVYKVRKIGVKFGVVKNFMELYLFKIGWYETAPVSSFWYVVFDSLWY